MELLLFLVVTVSLLLVLLDYMWKPKLNLPYPQRYPVIGHLLSFFKSQHIVLTTWAEACGDIYCIQLLNQCVVIVTGYEAAYEVMVTKGKEFGARMHTFRNDMISGHGRDIIFQSLSPDLKKLRLFTQQNIKQYGEGLGRIERIVQQTAEELIAAIYKESLKGAIDPFDNIHLTVANNITALVTGTHLTLDDPLFEKILQSGELMGKCITLSKGTELDAMPWLHYFGNETYRNLTEFQKLQSEIYDSIKMLYQTDGLSDDGLAYAFLDEMENNSRGLAALLTDEVIKVVLYDVLIAGVSTSSATLYIFLLVMASERNIQQKIFEEIVSCKGGNQQGEFISLSDRANMPYTRACLLELMRYSTIAPITADQTTATDTEILGHRIPKGTAVFVNLFGLHHSEKYWENPWEFRPERFLDAEGRLVPSDYINRKRLMAFGAGPRACIGQTLALARIFILATSLIKAFEISQCPGEPVCHDPRSYDFNLVLKPARVKLNFKKRL